MWDLELIQKKIIGQRMLAVTNRKRKVQNQMAYIEQLLAAMKLEHVLVENESDSLQKLLDDMGNVQVWDHSIEYKNNSILLNPPI